MIDTFAAASITGDSVSLADYLGKVLLIVNTASQCGLTPQYASLQALQRRYEPRGFAVLAFPCNQFGAQEPGSDADIQAFCARRYGASFALFAKIDVNGPTAHPLYQWLCRDASNAEPAIIEWNFTKFLIGKDGQIAGRYAPAVEPLDLSDDIERLLA